jgi:hypothetical protein
MGWTVYFRREPFADSQWNAFVEHCRKIVDQTDVALTNDMLTSRPGEAGKPPQVDEKGVGFNGVGEDSCETFYIPKESKDGFDFCKTRRLPYTAPVIACAMAARHHLGFGVSCDGWDEEIENGAKLFLKTLDEPGGKRRSWKATVRRYLGEPVPK